MTKDGFIRELEEDLQGEVLESQLNETLQYYRSYIDEEINLGKPEEEVLEGLGNPRLIARSVIDAYGNEQVRVRDLEYVQEDEDGEGDEGEGRTRRYRQSTQMTTKTQKIVGYVVFFGILLVAAVLLQYVMPFFLVFLIVWFIARTFIRRF